MGKLFRLIRWLDLKMWDEDWNRSIWEDKTEIGLGEAIITIVGFPIMYPAVRFAKLLQRFKIKEEKRR